MKHIHLTLLALFFSVVSFGQVAAIGGPSSVCIGNTITLTDATTGGTWTSADASIAPVNSVTGIVSGVMAGTTTIYYTVGTASASLAVTVDALPAPITGPATLCDGTSITEYTSPGGGVWTTSLPAIATVGSTSGILTGVSAGMVTLTYTSPGGCHATRAITVDPLPAPISGTATLCTGGTTILTDLTPGGIWSSSSPVVAYVSPTGTVTGNAAGTAIISYTSTAGCASVLLVTVTPASTPAYAVTGGGAYCTGGTGVPVGLANSVAGVSYQLFRGSFAVGSPLTGTGGALNFGLQTVAGTYVVLATTGGGCSATMSGSATVVINSTPAAYSITGGGSYCTGGPGSDIVLSASSIGVAYQLYSGGTLVGAAVPGTGAPLDFGLHPAGTYSIIGTDVTTGCTNTMSGTVTTTAYPLPTAYTVAGGGSYCSGGTGLVVALNSSDAGVNYTLYVGTTLVGTAVAGTGSSLSFGTETIAGVYTVVATNAITSCTANMIGSATIVVNPSVTPSVSITTTPGTTVCPGTPVGYTALPINGGTSPTYNWSVNGVATATGSFYSYTPLNGDVVAVLLTSSAICATPSTALTSVVMTVDVPTVTATAYDTSCGGIITLVAGGASTYSWSPSTGLSCTTCSITSVLPSSSTTYSVTGTDGTGCTSAATVTADGNRISGHISYSGGLSTDTFTVWLIQFHPSDSSIVALDSTTGCLDGGAPYFQFMDKASGSYLVKAKLNSAIPGTSGYIPTYGVSTPHWDSAATISHSGAADTMHINMVYGTVPTGPGFISGFVVAGAGKGTSGTAPVSGMTIYLKNGAGALITYTTTAPDGTYSFSNLADGTYQVFPETYKYYTTPSALITLAPGSDSSSAVNFKQHTASGSITPYDVTHFIPVIASQGISVFPNPASNQLNIKWEGQAPANATVTVTNITGAFMLRQDISVNPYAGNQIDLSDFTDGIYIISVVSDKISYTGKFVRQH